MIVALVYQTAGLHLETTEVGIYKRKRESKKKERRHAFDQESDQEIKRRR